MHRSETEELTFCAECGAEIAPALERAYSYGEGAALCWACAVRRGGSYDEAEDRWIEPPATADLRRAEP